MAKTSGVKMIHWLLFDEVLLGFLSKPNSPLGKTSSKSIYLIASNFKIKLETKINQFKNCPQGKLYKRPFNYINDQIFERRKHLTSTGKGFHRSSIFFSVTTVVVKKKLQSPLLEKKISAYHPDSLSFFPEATKEHF